MLRPRGQSISTKLTWMNLLVSGTALLLACLAFLAYDLVIFRQNSIRNLSTQARIIGANSVASLIFNDPQSAKSTLAALKDSPDILYAAILRPDGQPFALFMRDKDARFTPPPKIDSRNAEAYAFTGTKVVFVRLILFEGQALGSVYIEANLHEMMGRIVRYAAVAGLVLLLCLIAALLASSGFRRAVARPIVELAKIAHDISRNKDYAIRATPTGGADEIAMMIAAFNEMLGQIQQRDDALHLARNELEQRVHDRTAELEAVNKELEAFSYSVAHDLRGPLDTMDGFSYILLTQYASKLDAEGREYLELLRSGSRRMGALIDDLLNLSRITISVMHRQVVDLGTIAREVTDDLRKSEPDRKVEIVVGRNLIADGDANLLRIVLDNLLRNAWKYSSRHKSSRIEFGATPFDGGRAYFVRDDGAGFDPGHADRLFKPFQRLHAESDFTGTGIGLSTVARIIQRHGGKVWADGAPEQGATFYFTLK